jgi:TonB-linked SusC/RagA family outer membrane protein
MHRLQWKVFALVAVGALAPGALASPLAAQGSTGAVTGRVSDAGGQPVAAAQVVIVGTQRGAPTGDDGRYRLAALAPGAYQLRVIRIGYQAATRPVTVTAGTTATLDISLTPSAVSLDQVVVTATGEQVRRREQGNAVSSIQPDAEALAASANITDVLNSRTPGVQVQSSSGTSGTGSRVRIRGASSLSLTNEPLLIVDGIRANSDVGNRSAVGGVIGTYVGTGGQAVSRLNDINPEDIETIEVLKGPAGVALYGTAAANGVIQITTKKGRAGRTRWSGYAEGGGLEQTVALPPAYGMTGTFPTGAPRQCTNESAASGLCTQTTLRTLEPAKVDDPFRSGDRYAVGLNASGGSERLTFFAGGDVQQERGVQETNNDRRMNARANFRGELRPNWDLTFNSGYFTQAVQLPVNDNSTLGILPVTLLGRVFAADSISGGFYNNLTPTILSELRVRQNVDRFLSTAQSNYQPSRWLSFSGVAGLDYTQIATRQLVRPNLVPFSDLPQGSANSNPFSTYNWTAQGNTNLNFNLSDQLTSTTQLGAQYARELFRGTNAQGAVLAPGSGSLTGTSARFAVSEFNQDNVTIGVFAQQRFGWRDRLFLNAGLRGDRNSAFGSSFGFVYYPTANLSYVVSDEDFFPANDVVSSLQLRAAWGRSGQRPRFTDALTFYQPFSIRSDAGEQPAISFTNAGLGDPQLKPETSTETEVGFDLGLLDGRFTAQLTYYDKSTRDLLVQAPLAPSVGSVANQFRNLGTVNNRGWEFQVGGALFKSRPVTVEAQIGGSTLTNRLIDLGGGIAPIVFGSGAQQHRSGYPAGGFWQRPYTYADANGDGRIARTEVTRGDTSVYLGNPLPRRELQFLPALTLFERVRVSALFSQRGGFKVYNATNRFRCAFTNSCRDVNEPTAPLALQARAVAAAFLTTDAGYIEDADFVRLRELTVSISLPQQLARRARFADASLVLAGRNLATWTDYTGLDPEVSTNPAATQGWVYQDFLTVPPVRVWTARLNLSF